MVWGRRPNLQIVQMVLLSMLNEESIPGVNHINEYWWLSDHSHIKPIRPATVELRKQASIVIFFFHLYIKTKTAKSSPLLTYGPQTQKIKVFSRIQLAHSLHVKDTVTCCHSLLPAVRDLGNNLPRSRRCPPLCPTVCPAPGRCKVSISLIPGLKQLKLYE